MTEDEWLDDITDSMDISEQIVGENEGQGSLECCRPWGHKEFDTTEQLNRKPIGAWKFCLKLKRYLGL